MKFNTLEQNCAQLNSAWHLIISNLMSYASYLMSMFLLKLVNFAKVMLNNCVCEMGCFTLQNG